MGFKTNRRYDTLEETVKGNIECLIFQQSTFLKIIPYVTVKLIRKDMTCQYGKGTANKIYFKQATCFPRS
jgi:hypothetical protein